MEISPTQWNRIKELFEVAAELTPEQRLTFLKEHETDDAVLAEVKRLLDENETLGDFFSISPIQDISASLNEQTRRFEPGVVLGERFRIVRFIAAGGMGEVYEAEDLILKENLAIKTIRTDLIRHSKILARFKREVQLARKVTHQNV